MDDDQQAVQHVLDGDVDAFRKLVEKYQGKVLGLVRNLAPDRNDVEDIAQDAFVAAYVNLGSFDHSKGRFSTWLFTIARNRCINAMQKKRPIAVASVPERSVPESAEQHHLLAETFRHLDQALAKLPDEQRVPFVLSEIMGFALQEIAEIEGMKLGTVKSRISRAKDKLRAALKRSQGADNDKG